MNTLSFIILLCACAAGFVILRIAFKTEFDQHRMQSNAIIKNQEVIRGLLNNLLADNKNNIGIKTFILREYGVQLSDSDVLTLMIEWNKQIETLEDFNTFVKKYLDKKKWLYH